MLSLRLGVDELAEPDALRQLSELDEDQLGEVCTALSGNNDAEAVVLERPRPKDGASECSKGRGTAWDLCPWRAPKLAVSQGLAFGSCKVLLILIFFPKVRNRFVKRRDG
jgi:hypothetical protein